MNSSSYMTIQFLRKGDDTQDDLITIYPVGHGMYRVEFTITKNFVAKGSNPKSGTLMTFDDLKSYLRNMFHLLSLDQDPYECYQFDLPLMPSVIVNHTRLLELEDTVLSILEDYDANDTWPKRVTLQEKKSPRHIFFDEENGRVVEERY